MAAEACGMDESGQLYRLRGAAETKSKVQRGGVFRLRRLLESQTEENESDGMLMKEKRVTDVHNSGEGYGTTLDTNLKSNSKLTMKFIGDDRLVLTNSDDRSVKIYNISENKKIHDIRLTHPISSIDVWNDYLLIGSSVVHIVDTREDHWRRIIVVDMDENESLKNMSQHFAVFNSNGEFATASLRNNEVYVTLWPKPVKSGRVMTQKKVPTLSCGSDVDFISSLSVPAMKMNLLLVLGKHINQDVIISILTWNGYLMKTIMLPSAGMDISILALSPNGEFLAVKKDGKYITEHSLTSTETVRWHCSGIADITAMTYHSPQHLMVGLSDGHIAQSEDQEQTFPESDMELHVSSAVTSFACHDNRSAIGYQDGTVCIRRMDSSGSVPISIEISSSVFSELDAFSVFMPGSFTQRTIISNISEFEVTCEGHQFTSPHSYSLAIPKGAIKRGETVKIKTGVMAYGPCGHFVCPKGLTVISPIIWFMSEPEVHFQKPVVLRMQHCSSDYSSIGVLKGRHDDTSELFQISKIDVERDTTEEGYVSLSIDHFCIYCLGVYSEEHVENTRLCIIPIERWGRQEKEVIFCVTYCLDTCKEAVRDQYKDGYLFQSPIVVSLRDLSVHIQCILEDGSRCRALLRSGSTTILMSSINYWERFSTVTELVTAHDNKVYPPRFTYNISGGEENEKVKFIFTGLQQPQEYEVILAVGGNREEP